LSPHQVLRRSAFRNTEGDQFINDVESLATDKTQRGQAATVRQR
jgi:hypothetical protein